ncbi:unnamed protein product [Allacma fusca]|uniref:C3H1-type domain-containing protein n=1 Tax=Allacma fusca TaxID=39272 RepID=A0A8J2PY93_9HEXA|nr:unnamed protein product [Allacma fusca]
MEKVKAGTSTKKQKTAEYFRSMRCNEKAFHQSGLPRPQQKFSGLKFRTRQVNTGKLEICNPFKNIPLDPVPEVMMTPRFPNDEAQKKMDTMFDNIKPGWILNTVDFANFYNFITTTVSTFLKPILEDPTVLKIVHGGVNDYLWLQRDFNIFMRRILDTQVMHHVLSAEVQISFKDLVRCYEPEMVQYLKTETLSEWRLRPGAGITTEQEIYATSDVHFLIIIMHNMRRKLKISSPNGIAKAFELSEVSIEGKLYKVPNPTPAPSVDEADRGRNKDLTTHQKKTLNCLLEWRHSLASWVDTKDESLIKYDVLVKLVRLVTMPAGTDDITRVTGKLEEYVENQKKILLRILVSPNPVEAWTEIKQTKCQKCGVRGHPRGYCDQEKAVGYWKIYMKEHPEYAQKQYARRMRNLEENRAKRAAATEKLVAQPCKFFQRGNCSKGESCRFVHQAPPLPEPCKFFATGMCSRGSNCRFLH